MVGCDVYLAAHDQKTSEISTRTVARDVILLSSSIAR